MFVARARKVKAAQAVMKGMDSAAEGKPKERLPQLQTLLEARDFIGASTLCNFLRNSGRCKPAEAVRHTEWLAYSLFHLGHYAKALKVYKELLETPEPNPDHHLHAACCLFYLGMYKEADEHALKGPQTPLQNRVLFHLAEKMGDNKKLVEYHMRIKDNTEDQLCLAAMHYVRSHFQEATDIYKRFLAESKENLALHVYVALAYYKLDYFDYSVDVLQTYLDKFPDSTVAQNLKACNQFKLQDGKTAEAELKSMMEAQEGAMDENELIRHNLVVFRGGENALQVLPPLIDIIPEARLNLVVWHLRNHEVQEAYALMQDQEPTTPQEYILKAVANCALGQAMKANGNRQGEEHLDFAKRYFQLVGASQSECDTIPGRQCMASCLFLLKQFDDVLVYLNSIQPYCYNSTIFSYNHGVAQAAAGQYKEAEETLLRVQPEQLPPECKFAYVSWLCRCHIMNGNARLAWDQYIQWSAEDSFALLKIIGNDCYKTGAFLYSAKAFDVLERLDNHPDFWEAKRGACCGVFQMVIAKRAKKSELREVIHMLRNSVTGPTPQTELMITVMSQWARDNKMKGFR